MQYEVKQHGCGSNILADFVQMICVVRYHLLLLLLMLAQMTREGCLYTTTPGFSLLELFLFPENVRGPLLGDNFSSRNYFPVFTVYRDYFVYLPPS